MNTKAQSPLDFFYIMGIVFMVTIAVLAAYIIIDTTSNINIFQEDAQASANIQKSKESILNMDNAMLFIICGLSLFVIVSAAMVNNHPAYLVVGLILLGIALMFAAIMSNTFWTFIQDSNIMSAANNFPKIKFLMNNLPFYILFMGIASSISGYVGYQKL